MVEVIIWLHPEKSRLSRRVNAELKDTVVMTVEVDADKTEDLKRLHDLPCFVEVAVVPEEATDMAQMSEAESLRDELRAMQSQERRYVSRIKDLEASAARADELERLLVDIRDEAEASHLNDRTMDMSDLVSVINQVLRRETAAPEEGEDDE